jgi:hypothetical protein
MKTALTGLSPVTSRDNYHKSNTSNSGKIVIISPSYVLTPQRVYSIQAGFEARFSRLFSRKKWRFFLAAQNTTKKNNFGGR